MASKAVCWAYPPAFMADDATNLKPVPKLGHTKGERILAARSVPGACIVETMNVEPPCYICVRCGVVFAEEESDGG